MVSTLTANVLNQHVAVQLTTEGTKDFRQTTFRQVHGAGTRHQHTITVQQPHRQLVQAVVSLLTGLDVLATWNKGWRINDDNVELLALFLEVTQRLKGIAFPAVHFFFNAVQGGVLLNPIQREARGINTMYFAGAVIGRLHAPTTDIAEHVQHTLAAHQTVNHSAVFTVVVEPTGFLTFQHRCHKAGAVFN